MGHPTLEQAAVRAATLVAVDGRAYPLVSARLEARAEGGMAATTLRQAYANPYDEPLEVVYTLPLPADGAVLGYTIRIGERTILSEVQPRERAAAAYRDALYRGQTAGLLEEHRRDTFEQRLGNVPAHTQVEITIDVLHPLAFIVTAPVRRPEPKTWYHGLLRREDSPATEPEAEREPEWEYRFPTVVGVRYHGSPGRVPDAQALSPDRADGGGIPVTMELALVLADAEVGSVHSPSHGIDAAAEADAARVGFRQGERLDRDVIVRWAARAEAAGVRIVEGGGLAGDDGRYALVTVVPPPSRTEPFHREAIVLLDASGSMTGTPLALAKRVVAELIRSCEPGDRFELLAFSDDVRSLTRGMTEAGGRQVRDALAALDALTAGGGTEMSGAVDEALRRTRSDAQRQIVLVTDGEIGFESEVVGRIANTRGARFHVVGVGSSPNRGLTAAAAAAGRGLEVLVGDERDADDAARRLVAGTARPVLVDLEVSGTALAKGYASPLRDVYAGQPLVFAVELKRERGTLALSGELAGPHPAWNVLIEVPEAGHPDELARTPLPIGAYYGRTLVGQLEIELDCGKSLHREALESSLEAVAMRHRIVSRRTSLVAIAEEPAVDPRAPRRRERLAVELPAGVSAEGVGLDRAMPATMRMVAMMAPLVKGPMDRRSLASQLEMMLKRRGAGPIPTEATEGETEIAKREWFAIEAEMHWLEPEWLMIEFEVPVDGLLLPVDALRLDFANGWGLGATLVFAVDPARSTPAGPHKAGVRVRLAVRVPAETRYPAAQRAEASWKAAVSVPGRPVEHVSVVFRCILPGRPGDSH